MKVSTMYWRSLQDSKADGAGNSSSGIVGEGLERPRTASAEVALPAPSAEEILDAMSFLLDVIKHEGLGPQPSHSGSCHPDAGCDGACVDAYYFGVGMVQVHKVMSALRGYR